MRLLLHTCCAPCLIYPLAVLKEKGIEVGGFFYNPNIFPLSEYSQRRQALVDFNKTAGIEIIYPEYNPSEYAEAIKGKETSPQRCSLCWSLRLKKTAQVAKEKGFNCFTTTLLVSPYQDQGLLRGIGEHIEEEENIKFYYEDFRPGFKKAHDEAKAKGIYCQKYCGCAYSEVERYKKKGQSPSGTVPVR